jgi:hypothetical protein
MLLAPVPSVYNPNSASEKIDIYCSDNNTIFAEVDSTFIHRRRNPNIQALRITSNLQYK